jgi:hypothetical protein
VTVRPHKEKQAFFSRTNAGLRSAKHMFECLSEEFGHSDGHTAIKEYARDCRRKSASPTVSVPG